MHDIKTRWSSWHPYSIQQPVWPAQSPWSSEPEPRLKAQASKPAKRVRLPAPPPDDAFDPQHHLIYAAMIDGCCGQGALAHRLGVEHRDIKNAQKVLAKRGYIRMGYWNHHKAYVPCEINAGNDPLSRVD